MMMKTSINFLKWLCYEKKICVSRTGFGLGLVFSLHFDVHSDFVSFLNVGGQETVLGIISVCKLLYRQIWIIRHKCIIKIIC